MLGTLYGGTTAAPLLPNLKGRVPVGQDAAQGEFNTIGEAGGAKEHTLTVTEMPVHTHTQNTHTHLASTDAAGAHRHNSPTFTRRSSYDGNGDGLAADNGSGAFAQGYTTGRYNVPDQIPSDGAHTHPVTVTAATATNQNTGGGGAHNNLQPYLVLNYIIRAA